MAVNAGAGHRFGQPGGQHHIARHIAGLLAHLADAAQKHIVHSGRVGVDALDHRIDDLCGKSTGCQPASWPPRRPPAVRCAATIKASDMGLLCLVIV